MNKVEESQAEIVEDKSEDTEYYKKLTKTEVDHRIDELVEEAFK